MITVLSVHRTHEDVPCYVSAMKMLLLSSSALDSASMTGVSCVWYYLYMAILHAHVPMSFVSASRCMALLSVMCLALSQHHTALLLIDTA